METLPHIWRQYKKQTHLAELANLTARTPVLVPLPVNLPVKLALSDVGKKAPAVFLYQKSGMKNALCWLINEGLCMQMA